MLYVESESNIPYHKLYYDGEISTFLPIAHTPLQFFRQFVSLPSFLVSPNDGVGACHALPVPALQDLPPPSPWDLPPQPPAGGPTASQRSTVR